MNPGEGAVRAGADGDKGRGRCPGLWLSVVKRVPVRLLCLRHCEASGQKCAPRPLCRSHETRTQTSRSKSLSRRAGEPQGAKIRVLSTAEESRRSACRGLQNTRMPRPAAEPKGLQGQPTNPFSSCRRLHVRCICTHDGKGFFLLTPCVTTCNTTTYYVYEYAL